MFHSFALLMCIECLQQLILCQPWLVNRTCIWGLWKSSLNAESWNKHAGLLRLLLFACWPFDVIMEIHGTAVGDSIQWWSNALIKRQVLQQSSACNSNSERYFGCDNVIGLLVISWRPKFDIHRTLCALILLVGWPEGHLFCKNLQHKLPPFTFIRKSLPKLV